MPVWENMNQIYAHVRLFYFPRQVNCNDMQ